MMRTKNLGAVLAVFALGLAAHAQTDGASETKVKAKASAGKIDDKGSQMVSITLAIDKDWFLYANPVKHNNEFLNPNKTVVSFAVSGKTVKGTVSYPVGKVKMQGQSLYNIYTDTIKLDATVQRTPGDTSPLEITIAVNACTEKICLERGKIQLTVP